MQAFFGAPSPLMIMAIIVALVEVTRKIVEKEKLSWKFWAALLFGLILGGTFHLVNVEQVTSREAFNAVIYGLLCGLTPTGLYGAIQQMAKG